MRPTNLAGLCLIGCLLLVVGCGGGSASRDDDGAIASDPVTVDGSSTAPGDAGATVPPVATDAAPTSEPQGGGTAGDACGLVTVSEMEDLFGVSGVTQRLFTGASDTCDYQLDGAPFAAMGLTPSFGGFAFDAMAADAGSTPIVGIGDRAIYNRQHLTFLVQKGEAVLSIQVLDESRSEDERAEIMERIAAIAADRM